MALDGRFPCWLIPSGPTRGASVGRPSPAPPPADGSFIASATIWTGRSETPARQTATTCTSVGARTVR
jgi:hypothetical protein